MPGGKRKRDRLDLWKRRLRDNDAAYQQELKRMEEREAMYRGSDAIRPIVPRDLRRVKETPHVRNLAAEMIESQVDSNIPQPKVTPLRQEDEWRAKLIEDMLRNELDRMQFERMNDLMERMVPIQGGAAFLVEWDHAKRGRGTLGELAVSTLHPRQIVPQDGVYTGIEDMDYIILKVPQTKESIRRRYGVDVADEAEEEPDVKSGEGADPADDLVTQYVAYYRNPEGGIGLYSWVGDTELEDLEDYQARRLRRCAVCGAVEPQEEIAPMDAPAAGGLLPEDARPARRERGTCPYCGSRRWEDGPEGFEEIYVPIRRSDGSEIPGARLVETVTGEVDALGLPVVAVVEEPTRIPYYKPDLYPIVLQKNVSVYGRFLGESDIDKIADQQNTTNRIERKIVDKLVASGSYLSLPDSPAVKIDETDGKIIRLGNPADLAMIGVYDVEGDVEQDMAYLAQVYEEARQVIGITDSFQGRKDTTATSGTAKEFSAAQAAGRLESKRVMKDAAYADLFERMFKFKLAYADEPRPVVAQDIHGRAEYKAFDRYDFLDQDANGEWYWDDDFLFSCDTSAPLASNREAMWQETRMNLQTGAFGDPTSFQTLILFWTKMEMLHYPGAGETRAFLEEELRRQQEQMERQMALQQQAQAQQVQGQLVQGVLSQAREDAARDAGAPAG